MGSFHLVQPSVSVQREVGAWMPAKGSPPLRARLGPWSLLITQVY